MKNTKDKLNLTPEEDVKRLNHIIKVQQDLIRNLSLELTYVRKKLGLGKSKLLEEVERLKKEVTIKGKVLSL